MSGGGGDSWAHGESQPIPWPVRMGDWRLVLGGGVYTLCAAAGGCAHMGGGTEKKSCKIHRCCWAAAPNMFCLLKGSEEKKEREREKEKKEKEIKK